MTLRPPKVPMPSDVKWRSAGRYMTLLVTIHPACLGTHLSECRILGGYEAACLTNGWQLLDRDLRPIGDTIIDESDARDAVLAAAAKVVL